MREPHIFLSWMFNSKEKIYTLYSELTDQINYRATSLIKQNKNYIYLFVLEKMVRLSLDTTKNYNHSKIFTFTFITNIQTFWTAFKKSKKNIKIFKNAM